MPIPVLHLIQSCQVTYQIEAKVLVHIRGKFIFGKRLPFRGISWIIIGRFCHSWPNIIDADIPGSLLF